MTTFGELLLDDLAPFVTPATDPVGDHTNYLLALAQIFEEITALAMDQGFPDDPGWIPGWSVLLDVDACPTAYLPFLGQFVGVTIPPGSDDATSRQIIRAESNQHRGTPTAVISAAKRNLSGTQSVALLERTAADGSPNAWHFCLLVRPEEIVSIDQLTIDVNNVKPAGIMWTLVQSDAPLVLQYTRLFSAITVPLNAATLADVT